MDDLLLSHKQRHALERVEEYQSHPGHRAWAHIRPDDLAKQLQRRISDPNCIRQVHSPWCGPAGVFCSFATDSPDAYAKMVIDLVRHGRATVHHGRLSGLTLHPNAELRRYFFPWTKIAAADWVPLATIRDSLRPTHKHFKLSSLWHGTFPEDVVRFYHELGYCEVHDLTSQVQLSGHYAYQFAKNASEFLRRHYRVTLRINADMLHPQTQKNNSGRHNHWVDLISPVEILGPSQSPDTTVFFEVFSWGHGEANAKMKGLKIPQEGTLTLQDFAKNYFGFVCAKY